MESVRLAGDPLESLAGVDEIINRGDREAFSGLLHAIIKQPDGPVAERVCALYERVQHRAGDPELAAWPQYQAAYWLSVAIRQFSAPEATGQRFASVWDAIEGTPEETEKMKLCSVQRMEANTVAAQASAAVLHAVYTLADYPVLASIAAKRTQARKLDGRACLHLYKSALGEIDWMTITPQEKEFMQRLGFV